MWKKLSEEKPGRIIPLHEKVLVFINKTKKYMVAKLHHHHAQKEDPDDFDRYTWITEYGIALEAQDEDVWDTFERATITTTITY